MVKVAAGDDGSPELSPEDVLTEEQVQERSAAFARRRPFPAMALAKMVFFGSFLIPIRIILMIVFNIFWLPILSLSLSGSANGKFTGIRRTILHWVFWIWIRTLLLIFGLYWIRTKGKRPNEQVLKSFVAIGNHIGWLDVAFIAMTFLPSFVAKASVAKIPVVGAVTRATGAIFVERALLPTTPGASEANAHVGGGSGKPSATELIKEKLQAAVTEPETNCVAMFPEGTTTNGTHLIHFRHGAFIPGVPVVPLIFKFHFLFFDPACCSYSLLHHVLLTMASPSHWMTVEYLDPYMPSEEEKANHDLYSRNVHSYMVKNSHLKDCDFTYADKLRWEAALGYENADVRKAKKAAKKVNISRTSRKTQSNAALLLQLHRERTKDKTLHPGMRLNDDDIEHGASDGSILHDH